MSVELSSIQQRAWLGGQVGIAWPASEALVWKGEFSDLDHWVEIPLMISASKSTINLKSRKILRPKVTKILRSLRKKFYEFQPWFPTLKNERF